MIAASGLTLRAGTRMLLENLNFEFGPRELVAVLGPNGVGKTTLLRTLAGARAAAMNISAVTSRYPLASAPRPAPGKM